MKAEKGSRGCCFMHQGGDPPPQADPRMGTDVHDHSGRWSQEPEVLSQQWRGKQGCSPITSALGALDSHTVGLPCPGAWSKGTW